MNTRATKAITRWRASFVLAVLRTKRRRQQQSKQFVVTPERLDETLITSESFYAVRAASPAQGPGETRVMPKYPTQDPNYRILAQQWSRFTHYYFYIRIRFAERDYVCASISAGA